jgi:polysaccharide pyruvyl transferase WcaK-like protein
MARFCAAISGLFEARDGLSFLLIPHDYRPYKGCGGDLEVAQALLDLLPERVRRHSAMVRRCRASEVRAISGRLDLIVTGLMHLAIGSVEQGTPVACLAYQGKFEGLMSHFDIAEPNAIVEPQIGLDSLAEFVVPLIEARVELREKLTKEVPRIRRLAEANLVTRRRD